MCLFFVHRGVFRNISILLGVFMRGSVYTKFAESQPKSAWWGGSGCGKTGFLLGYNLVNKKGLIINHVSNVATK
jgi:hypothetical protein